MITILFTACRQRGSTSLPEGEEISPREKVVVSVMEKMSTEEKIAQLLMITCGVSSYNQAKLALDIREYQPGGFLLMPENIVSYTQLQQLIADMQADSKIPLLIAIDQEGGRVQKIRKLKGAKITVIPPMAKIGAKNDPQAAYEIGLTIGSELLPLGINMDLAPCADIVDNAKNKVIGDRSFGKEPQTVKANALSLAQGLRDSGIIPVFKHFPGHGSTSADSHVSLPVNKKTVSELAQWELVPFAEAINQGFSVIMTAHIALPAVNGDNTPATLSDKLINELLRKELGFSGVVISDALNMNALRKYYSTEEILINSLNAGVDILLMPGNTEKTIAIIKTAVEDGRVSMATIDASVKRILLLKYDYGLLATPAD